MSNILRDGQFLALILAKSLSLWSRPITAVIGLSVFIITTCNVRDSWPRWLCGCLITGIAGSNTAEGMVAWLLCLLCVATFATSWSFVEKGFCWVRRSRPELGCRPTEKKSVKDIAVRVSFLLFMCWFCDNARISRWNGTAIRDEQLKGGSEQTVRPDSILVLTGGAMH